MDDPRIAVLFYVIAFILGYFVRSLRGEAIQAQAFEDGMKAEEAKKGE